MKNLNIILIIVAMAIIGAVAYYFGYDHGWEKAMKIGDQSQVPVHFSNEGLLVRNRDGLKTDTWYLSYETGNGGKLAELIVSNEKIGSFTVGQRVAVVGNLSSDKLAVENINPVSGNDRNSGAEVSFRKSDVYGFYGTLTLTGYLDTVRRVCNPGDMCDKTVDYASFIFTNTDNKAIKEFAGEYQGNSFVGDFGVGIGCLQKNEKQIYYENDADSGWKIGQITGADYTKLLSSSKEKPVQLKLTREIYTSGRGAPDCYSHFRNFDVL